MGIAAAGDGGIPIIIPGGCGIIPGTPPKGKAGESGCGCMWGEPCGNWPIAIAC